MLIETTLLADDQALVEGLFTGGLKRFGGVIRDSSNGRIVRHLLEAPDATVETLVSPNPHLIARIGDVANAVAGKVTSQNFNALQQTLSSVLQVSQVAAAASVLNLGVSVVGFAYMGYKLNQLDKAMSSMQASLGAGFRQVGSQLDAIGQQLNYVALLAGDGAEQQRRIRDSLAELHRTVLVIELAELQSWLDQLSRFPGESPKEAMRVSNKVRRTLSDQAVRVSPELEACSLLVADISIRGWAVATATEANLLMVMGQHRDARQMLEAEHRKFSQLVERWADVLLADPQPQLHTAYRFAAPRFRQHVLQERIDRIARVHRPDAALSAEHRLRAAKEASLEFEMTHNQSLGEEWTNRQLAVAEYLDGLSELSSRFESLGAFARECEARKLPSSQLALPGTEVPAGLYVLPAVASS